MVDRDKVINGLYEALRVIGNSDSERYMAYSAWAIEDAIALLKSQEPRVMTLEEANTFEVVWVEDRSTNTVFPCLVKNNMNDSKLYKHGIQWRCWTSRPSDEQREATPWD